MELKIWFTNINITASESNITLSTIYQTFIPEKKIKKLGTLLHEKLKLNFDFKIYLETFNYSGPYYCNLAVFLTFG